MSYTLFAVLLWIAPMTVVAYETVKERRQRRAFERSVHRGVDR